MFKQYKKLWLGLLALMIISPLGLLTAGTAFGEWELEELVQEIGFIPQGLQGMAEIWKHALLPDYSLPGASGGFIHSALGYMLSAFVGVGLISLVISLFSKVVKE